MKELRFQRAHRLAQLQDELIAAFPEWVTGSGENRTARHALSGIGDDLILSVPDEADPAAVAAVVVAHVPAALVAAPALTSAQRDLLRAYFAGTEPSTLAEMRAVLRALTVFLRRRLGEA